MAQAALKTAAKLTLVFAGTVALFVLLLVCAALVPRSAIQGHMLETAEFLCERPAVFELVPGVKESTVDRYADSLLMSIVYFWDEEDPLGSVMRSSFYGDWTVRQNELLLESVANGRSPNQEYIRYWHGSGVILRPLHLICGLREIYILCAVVLCALVVWLMMVLHGSRMDVEAVGVCVTLAAVNLWFVPFCLEFVWVFLIAVAASAIAVPLAIKGKRELLAMLFMVVGMITAYLDFLTAETLTLTIPLLLVVRACDKESSCGRLWSFAVCCGVLWLLGYAGAWASKWALASVVLGKDAMPYVSGHIAERLDRNVGLDTAQYLWQTIERNVSLQYGSTVAVVLALTLLCVIAFMIAKGKLVRSKSVNWSRVMLFFAIGLVPYVRYLALHAHAWQHAGFTYRAQAATVLAVWLIMSEVFVRSRAEAGASGISA